jgi:hypothetical protein
MAMKSDYNWRDADARTIEAMRDRCAEEGHQMENRRKRRRLDMLCGEGNE